MIISQLHAVVQIFGGPSDVQDVDKAVVRARNRLERGHPLELPEKCALAIERAAVNNFYRAKRPDHRARQPNLTVSAAPDHAKQFVIGYDWYLSRNLIGNGRILHKRGTRSNPGKPTRKAFAVAQCARSGRLSFARRGEVRISLTAV